MVQLVSYLMLGVVVGEPRSSTNTSSTSASTRAAAASRAAGALMSRLQDGRVQNYLRVIGLALAVLVLFLIWGCQAS